MHHQLSNVYYSGYYFPKSLNSKGWGLQCQSGFTFVYFVACIFTNAYQRLWNSAGCSIQKCRRFEGVGVVWMKMHELKPPLSKSFIKFRTACNNYIEHINQNIITSFFNRHVPMTNLKKYRKYQYGTRFWPEFLR